MGLLLKVLFNAALFQVGWILSVLYGNSIALVIALAAILIYGAYYLRSRAEFALIVSVILLGFAGDTLLGITGILVYPSGAPYPPFWMVTLWLLFATTIPWSLRWIAAKRTWFVMFSAVGGPVSYLIGVNLSGVTLGTELLLSLLILGFLWAIHGLVIQYFFTLWQSQSQTL